MTSETIIIILGLFCLLLAVSFILFKPQFFIFINRLVRRETKPWIPYQKLKDFLLTPFRNFFNAILPKADFSFRQAYSWTVIASIIFWLLYSIIIWLKISFPINFTNILMLLKECLFAGLFLPIGVILLTGLVHSLVKLFRRKGDFQKFFITYIAYNARPLILFIATLLIWTIFEIEAVLFFYVIFFFLLLFVPMTAAIKNNYRFNLLASFFIGLFVQSVFFLSLTALFFMLNPSIINR